MLRYAITDGTQRPGNTPARLCLLAHAERWAAAGIDCIQIREKALPAGELCSLVRSVSAIIGSRSRLLINSRCDVALATAAPGVHLTSHPDELTPAQVRTLYARLGLSVPTISVSCHSLEDVSKARSAGATLILFAPVFAKVDYGAHLRDGRGLHALTLACQAAGDTPVLALGGVSPANAPECIRAGASGVAGIRLFA